MNLDVIMNINMNINRYEYEYECEYRHQYIDKYKYWIDRLEGMFGEDRYKSNSNAKKKIKTIITKMKIEIFIKFIEKIKYLDKI